MVSRFRVLILAAVLSAAGGALFYYKWQVLGYPLVPRTEAEIWTVEVTMQFEAGPGPVKANLHIPALTPGFAIFDENFLSRGFGFTTRYVSGGRQVQWAIRRARGPQTLYYRSTVYKDPARAQSDTTPPFPPAPTLEEPFNTAMDVLVAEIAAQSADPASFTVALLQRLATSGADQNADLLLGPAADLTDRARVATTLLAAARIPARLLHGIYLTDRERRATTVPWLEIHDGERWLYFDPATGEAGLPGNFLVWWRGEDPLFTLEGGSDVSVQFAVQSSNADPLVIAQRRAQEWQSRVADFSLFALPIQTQAVYGVLLMIPVGALMLVILRNIIGLQTFGTFMPVLIALAFRETQLVAGLTLFTIVVALGLGFRFYLEHLRLLLVPRLASVLTIVVLLMLLVSLLSQQLDMDTGLSIALFPMVIMTMTIERMSIVWEERGAGAAIQQGTGSLFAASLCYLAMEVDTLQHLVFVFPELLLLVLAASLVLGRYTGYRLVELTRFRDLAGEGK